MSKYLSRLAILLVEEVHGPLLSRVFAELVVLGYSPFRTLQDRTKLRREHVARALSLLNQQNLVSWYSPADGPTIYEANLQRAYDLLRHGKYLRISQERFGETASVVIFQLLKSGYRGVGDLADAVHASLNRQASQGRAKSQALTNGVHTNHDGKRAEDSSTESVNCAIKTLLDAGLLCRANLSHFRTDTDNRLEAESRTPAIDESKARTKAERESIWDDQVNAVLRRWKHGFEGPEASETLEHVGDKRTAPIEGDIRRKKQKLNHVNDDLMPPAFSFGSAAEDTNHDFGPMITKNDNIRVVQEKFTAMMRTEQLHHASQQIICSATSKVYQKVLQCVEQDLYDCHSTKVPNSTDNDQEEDEMDPSNIEITTEKIAIELPTSISSIDSLGHVEGDADGPFETEHRKRKRRRSLTNGIHDQEDEMQVKEEDGSSQQAPKVSIMRPTKSTAGDKAGTEPEHDLEMMSSSEVRPSSHYMTVRAHLLLLAESSWNFVSSVSYSSIFAESWYIDFDTVVRHLQKHVILQTITARFGMASLRLVNILSEHGKLDEKTLSSYSLIREKEMRTRLVDMEKAGFLGLQEVPRDNARVASRSTFLYFFDHDRCKASMLEDCYMTMTRLVERLQTEREKVQVTLEKASRSDVVGREAELLSEHERRALQQWQGTKERLWGQVGRLDDMVALFQDF